MVLRPQKNPAPFNDEFTLLDIIEFFKANFKIILLFMFLGCFLGFLSQKLISTEYNGSVLISPGIVAGIYIDDSRSIVTKLNSNSFYSKQTFLACNPSFNKDTDIDYEISNIVKPILKNDGVLIELKMNSSNKEMIHSCLENIINDINASQKKIADPLIKSKKDKLNLIVTQLNVLQDLKVFSDKEIKNLIGNEETKLKEKLNILILFSKFLAHEILDISTQRNSEENDLSPERTKESAKILPINIQISKFSSLKFLMSLGLIIGGGLGIFVSFFKKYAKVK
jgi:hypothetical protein